MPHTSIQAWYHRLGAQFGRTAWSSPLRRVVTALVALIGLVSSIYGLWPLVFPETPDVDVKLFPQMSNTVRFDAQNEYFPNPPIVSADTILIDRVSLEAPKGAVFLANKLTLMNGAVIRGDDFVIVTPVIQGGILDASGKDGSEGNAATGLKPSPGKNGGRIYIAAAVIEGTTLRAGGGSGGKGGDGADGLPKPHAQDGRDGDCRGFGAYRGAQRGVDGQQGAPGHPGQDGAPGGDGGKILLLLSSVGPAPIATAQKGVGGKRGIGGRGGPGQQGGKGGTGCVGLGGSQTGQSGGQPGLRGPDGKKGDRGTDGRSGVVTIRHIHFRNIAAAWHRTLGDVRKHLSIIWDLPALD